MKYKYKKHFFGGHINGADGSYDYAYCGIGGYNPVIVLNWSEVDCK